MKIIYCLIIMAIVFCVKIYGVNGSPKPFLDKLFSGYDSSYGYGGYDNSYRGYYPSRPRSYGRSYDNNIGGGDRYKSICRVHAVDSLAFPGRVGNPVCP